MSRIVLLLALSVGAMLGQTDIWTRLRGISPGQTVHVHLVDGTLQKGRFISTDEGAIVVRQRTGGQSFAKDQIRTVSVRKASKRWRNAGIGAAIGAGATAGLVGYVKEGGEGAGFYAAAIGIYGLVGAGIGALFPGYDTIYRRPGK